MDFFERHTPTTLAELVFADPAVRTAIERKANVRYAGNLLLHGKGGAGKSAACRVVANTLLSGDYRADLTVINVSRLTTKAALSDAIDKSAQLVVCNPLEKRIFLLEELDGADRSAQKALKGILDDVQSCALFLATTNDLGEIIEPLRDRFLQLEIARPSRSDWKQRAVSILRREGVTASEDIAAQVIRNYAASSSMRDVLRALEQFVLETRQANAA